MKKASPRQLYNEFCSLVFEKRNDCRNNFDNGTFEPISDEIAEICYMKKYNLFEKTISKFVSSNLMKAEIEKTYH